jgi:subtilisin family serine protease
MSRSSDRQHVSGGGFGRPTHRAAFVALVAALLAAGGVLAESAVSGDPEPPVPSLCSVPPPVDDLLRCRTTTAPTTTTAQSSTPGGQVKPSGQETAVTLTERPPHRITAVPRFVPDLLLVAFRRGTSARQRGDTLAKAGVTLERRIRALGVAVVRMRPEHRDDALAQLRASRFVATAEKDAVFEQLDITPNDADWSAQWGLRRIGLPSAWDRPHGSGNVVVAVLDTGVAGGHPDLQGSILSGYNLVDPAKAPVDDNGHGTAVAGIIAARTNNHEGIAGVCWTCSILPIKVLAADGTGDTSRVAAGIVRAADAGARVINMSLGGPANDRTLDDAISYALGKGVILVAAAGNNGTSSPFYPAANLDVISVAASDESDRLYSWSNFGSSVQVAAPGCNPAPSPAGGYVLFCGTSAATPVVAGLVALLLSVQPDAGRAEVVNAIENTTTPIGDVVGRGRIDARNALAALIPAPVTVVAPSKLIVKSSLSSRINRRVYRRSTSGGRVTATVTFRGAKKLALTIRNHAGAVVGLIAGASPLRFANVLPAGRFSFTVSGRTAKAAFTLVVSFVADSSRAGP